MRLPSLARLVSRPLSRPVARSLPFVSMDWVFPLFPKLDKFAFFVRYIQGSFLLGAAFVLFVYHTPYQGADYDHELKSPWYKWTHERLRASGKLHENLKIKRTSFYGEEVEGEEEH